MVEAAKEFSQVRTRLLAAEVVVGVHKLAPLLVSELKDGEKSGAKTRVAPPRDLPQIRRGNNLILIGLAQG